MLTVEEVAAIPLFSTLPAGELERLARTAADLRLSPGEFAVHEGGEGALYAVLAGKIQVIKTFDGVERTLGWRLPGAIFGEVPIALGTPFPGGYRAAEPSRVLRIDVQQYYALAAIVEGCRPKGQRARARADRRPAEHHRRAAEAARHIGRTPLGHRVRRAAPLSGPQPNLVRLAAAGHPGR